MTRTDYRLVVALALSLLLHLAPLLRDLLPPPAPPPAPPPLRATLAAPPLPQQVPLSLPEQPRRQAEPPPAARPAAPQGQTRAAARTPGWQQEIRRQLQRQNEQGLFYPAAAIAQGLEGEVLVFMLLDADGRVAAARVEASSGHRLLDDAALRAVRSLSALPADAPRETLLPVRFRLN